MADSCSLTATRGSRSRVGSVMCWRASRRTLVERDVLDAAQGEGKKPSLEICRRMVRSLLGTASTTWACVRPDGMAAFRSSRAWAARSARRANTPPKDRGSAVQRDASISVRLAHHCLASVQLLAVRQGRTISVQAPRALSGLPTPIWACPAPHPRAPWARLSRSSSSRCTSTFWASTNICDHYLNRSM
jgi:hypothetical protein